MAARKVNKREREATAEPMETQHAGNQASIQQFPAESYRARVWEMHLRGVPKTRIAEAVDINRETVATIIKRCYTEIAAERKFSPARKLDAAVARWRLVQEQAWNDHDADDERERQVLALSLANAANAANTADAADAADAKARHSSPSSNVTVRYQSQRAQYLRIILDAEKEIARLEGLYEGLLDVDAAVAVTFIQLSEEEVQRARKRAQGGQIASSATLAGIPAPASDGGESSE